MVEYDFVKVPIVDIVNQIILYAAQHRASDIHFDPLEDALMIRMRIDGDLQNHSLVPKVYERNLITRVKLIAAMNITETRLPQDGAIKGRIGGRDLDMRVSILPTNEGEKCVIRILDFQKGLNGLEELGFSKNNLQKVKKMLGIPNGIILVTGATGSGKSTTTYSMLSVLNKEETNIITVEDPIEMNIEGINQVQVNTDIGLTFASALRSILRQDPNIILIGEMRDEETAQIAVRASITGHLVLSTIHTNNALATIERLIDMGVERYMLATSVAGIISQKLVRTLCNKCKGLRRTTKYERYMFARILHKKVKEIYEPVGCSECHQGFTGRMALHEVLYISEHLRDLISDENIDKEQLRQEVYGNGETTTLLQDALQKVLAGYTTFQEVYRVVDVDVDLDNAIKSEMGLKPEDMDLDTMDEDDDWQDFDGVFDDELELIDIDQSDETDLPTLDTSILDVVEIKKDFNKTLNPSDVDFVKFFIYEDNKVMVEDTEAERLKFLEEEKQKEKEKALEKDKEQQIQIDEENNASEEINAYDVKDTTTETNIDTHIDENKEDNDKLEIIDAFDNINNPLIDEFDLTDLDADDIVLGQQNTIDNVIGGQGNFDHSLNRVLNLDNVEFNYKDLLDLIDAYSNIGPTISDVVEMDIKDEEKEKY